MSTPGEVLRGLVELLALEKLEENLFRGQSRDLGWGTVFGGQVLGQALSAAVRTVPTERRVHSLHAYFLRPGDVKKPIVYDVDRIRDGGSFTARRVRAIQDGQAILSLAASFQGEEPGFVHQDPMPEVAPAESFAREADRAARHADRLPDFLKPSAVSAGPFELRLDDPIADDPFAPAPRPPRRRVWLRTIDRLPDDPALHAYLLAYASDYAFLTTALLPHGKSWLSPRMQIASLDHAIWFHNPFRVDDWVLHVMDAPAASNARGLVRGQVFTKDGLLAASTAQEGLIRQRAQNQP